MALNHNTKNALKGFLLNIKYEMKVRLILTGVFILIMSLLSYDGNFSISSYKVIIVIMLLCVWKFMLTSNKEMFKKFVFPITRRVYAIGMSIYIIVEAFLALLIVLVINVIEQFFSNTYTGSVMTIGDYLVNFWAIFCFLVFFSSLAYFLGMFFHRYKIQTIAVIFLLATSSVPHFLELWNEYIYTEESIGLLSIKLLLLSVIFNLIAYLPLKKYEIKSD